MTIRNYGSFDGVFAHYIAASRLGRVAKTYTVRGVNPSVTSPTPEDVWDASSIYQYQDTAGVLSCVSTSAEDNPAGAGIGIIKILGLNGDWDMVEESVTLNGLTPVNTVNEYIRVLSVIGSKPGSADPNVTFAGQVKLERPGAILQATILAGGTTTNMSLFSIPRGYSGFLTQVWAASGTSDNYLLSQGIREFGDIFIYGPDFPVEGLQFPTINLIPSSGYLPEKSDFKFVAKQNNVGSAAYVGYVVVLLKNDYLNSILESV